MAGYEINSNKSVAFLYSKDKQAEKKLGKQIIHNSHKLYKVSCYDSNQTSERSVWQELQASEERNKWS